MALTRLLAPGRATLARGAVGVRAAAQLRFSSTYDNLLVTRPAAGVQLVTLNRPKALNALSTPLIADLHAALRAADADADVGVVVLTGSEKAFAAGADIKEMKDKTFADVATENFIAGWSAAMQIRKPVIAAVNGYALGGGCELAMMADIVYAGDKAVFGQPEIKLGIIPGAGGTQRLTRAIGRARAMELILTGANFSAEEAAAWGLVARVFPAAELVDEAVKTAARIAGMGRLAVLAAKQSINYGLEVGQAEGLVFERKTFHSLFATADQKEGMAAFAEKRKPRFTHA
ncbi:ClpP/crotonase-like domain-containing protein [Dipodascopsis tothii]|uniref:ClpP/crotonase-like domain-containing protein n=1 Tax=Dipodascopsis tothii TaxID=44089 RepID=UPI0034CF37B4